MDNLLHCRQHAVYNAINHRITSRDNFSPLVWNQVTTMFYPSLYGYIGMLYGMQFNMDVLPRHVNLFRLGDAYIRQLNESLLFPFTVCPPSKAKPLPEQMLSWLGRSKTFLLSVFQNTKHFIQASEIRAVANKIWDISPSLIVIKVKLPKSC